MLFVTAMGTESYNVSLRAVKWHGTLWTRLCPARVQRAARRSVPAGEVRGKREFNISAHGSHMKSQQSTSIHHLPSHTTQVIKLR